MQHLVEGLDELGALIQAAKPDRGRWCGQAARVFELEVEALAHDLAILRNQLDLLPKFSVVV
jgi:hypothetical protein